MKKILSIVIASCLFTSCEKAIMPSSASADPAAVFDNLWQTIDRGYSFFEYKNIDWNAVYQTYRPQVTNDMTDRELFAVCADMLRILKDGHVNLRAGFSNFAFFRAGSAKAVFTTFNESGLI